jgi:hypothetical protein
LHPGALIYFATTVNNAVKVLSRRHLLGLVVLLCRHRLDVLDDAHALQDLTEDDVLAVLVPMFVFKHVFFVLDGRAK